MPFGVGFELIDSFNIFFQIHQWTRNWIRNRNRHQEDEEAVWRRRRTRIIRILRNRQQRQGAVTRLWIQPELHDGVRASYWENVVPLYTEERFQRKFRISRTSFAFLVDELSPTLFKEDTRLRRAISVEKRIAIALCLLKSNADSWTVADMFGIGRSTATYILHEFCYAINFHLYNRLVAFPHTEREKNEVAKGFLNRWQFPGCIGALDGSHIPIMAPGYCPQDYYNYKSYHSIVLLGLVDYNYKFIYTNIGRPGRMNDASVFASSGLYRYLDSNPPSNHHHIIGDAAFPLLLWMLVPYVQVLHMPLEQFNFNYRMSSARMVVENAFGRLKGRFRILLKRSDFSHSNMNAIIKACIVLHNLAEENHDMFYPHWTDAVTRAEVNLPQPVQVPYQRVVGLNARAKRDQTANYLMNDGVNIRYE